MPFSHYSELLAIFDELSLCFRLVPGCMLMPIKRVNTRRKKNIWDVNSKYGRRHFRSVPTESEAALAAPSSTMLLLGRRGIALCSQKSISLLVTRSAPQMGSVPIPRSVPFVPVLIPISGRSPVSCPLELVSTCCSFLTQARGCSAAQTLYSKVSASARLFLKAWEAREEGARVPGQPRHRQDSPAPDTGNRRGSRWCKL